MHRVKIICHIYKFNGSYYCELEIILFFSEMYKIWWTWIERQNLSSESRVCERV